MYLLALIYLFKLLNLISYEKNMSFLMHVIALISSFFIYDNFTFSFVSLILNF
jgi:hypothetical protein